MRHILSRVLAAIELAVFLIPASYRAVFAVVLLWLDPFGKSVFPVDLFVLLLTAIAAMTALWRILGAFVIRGDACFQGIHRMWWWLVTAGALMVIVALPIRIWLKNQPGLPFSPMIDFLGHLSIVGYAGLDTIRARFDRALATRIRIKTRLQAKMRHCRNIPVSSGLGCALEPL
jgi:hypothetical protein